MQHRSSKLTTFSLSDLGLPGNVDLREVRRLASELKEAAFRIKAPNELTPQVVAAALHIERLCDEAERG